MRIAPGVGAPEVASANGNKSQVCTFRVDASKNLDMQHLDPAPAELDPEAELVVVRPTPERTSPPRSERQHAWGSPRSVEMSPPSQRSTTDATVIGVVFSAWSQPVGRAAQRL